jgi:beta-1,4-mannooligosaccharide/beta-1,4-mannosyl-N-acetylglucosamine phosphorylase
MNGYIYQMGCMLLDLEDPSKIRGKMNEVLMSPEEYYERVGIVGNVTFPTAALRHGGPDELKIYYGAADTCIGLAFAKVSQLVEECLRNPR